jgi:hypothetical protein
VTLEQFQQLVKAVTDGVPSQHFEGVAAVDVSPRTVPHPVHPDVYTMGECIPFDTGTDEIVSRVVLYYGSFRALAQHVDDFDWEAEARETVVHELRHHIEWRAGSEHLEAYDRAVEQNLKRQNGEAFDVSYYRDGEVVADGIWRVEDSVFMERVVTSLPTVAYVEWRSDRYEVAVPDSSVPVFLVLKGLRDAPSGDVCLVFQAKLRLRDLFRRPPDAKEMQAHVARVD